MIQLQYAARSNICLRPISLRQYSKELIKERSHYQLVTRFSCLYHSDAFFQLSQPSNHIPYVMEDSSFLSATASLVPLMATHHFLCLSHSHQPTGPARQAPCRPCKVRHRNQHVTSALANQLALYAPISSQPATLCNVLYVQYKVLFDRRKAALGVLVSSILIVRVLHVRPLVFSPAPNYDLTLLT